MKFIDILPTDRADVELYRLTRRNIGQYVRLRADNVEHLSRYERPKRTDLWPSEDLARMALKDMLGETGSLHMGIWAHDESQGLVGGVMLQPGNEGQAYVGYWLDESMEGSGKGYATLAVRAITAYGATQFNHIYAEILPANERSIRLAERCDFHQVSRQAGALVYKYMPHIQQ